MKTQWQPIEDSCVSEYIVNGKYPIRIGFNLRIKCYFFLNGGAHNIFM